MNKLNPSLRGAQEPQQVVVRLTEDAVAEVAESGGDAAAQQGQLSDVEAQQGQVVAAAQALDPSAAVLGSAQVATNVVVLEMDGAALSELAARSDVISINPVIEYKVVLDETVPYIGGTAVHDLGFTGEGVTVAVIDSGIDYTHLALGGPGTLEAYEEAYGTSPADPRNTTLDGVLFPSAKVIGGFDFIGESWAGGDDPLAPDPDPIDFDGHGTHVADIIGGVKGVAPGVSLYGLKVCSSVTPSCSGVALLQAMDFAVDPNGDGDTSDHVDIINMSLGSDYGQAFDDDLATAVDNATAVGVLTVAASGNGGDKPYKTSTPAAAPTALSVAQTEVPSATQDFLRIVSPEAIAGLYVAVWQSWSAPLVAIIEGKVQYGDGAGGNLTGCDPFAAGSLDGKVVLVDRGVCSFSIKITNIAEGGGLAGLIAQNTPEPPFPGGFGGGNPFVPGFMISQADGNLIKGQIDVGVVARFDPAEGQPLVGTVVSTSSRGPTMLTNRIKPEIAAPGASISAEVGTGNGVTPFGGTSGATPMVAGSAALMLEAHPDRKPYEVKAALINTGDPDIMNTPDFAGGDLAPITRIGGGEVRVDQAVTSPVAAFDASTRSAALSFGFRSITQEKTLITRVVAVRNYSNQHILYRVKSDFRFASDDTGAVEVKVPPLVWAPKGKTTHFAVLVVIDGDKLQEWGLNSGANGANANLLTQFEYDGYITLDNVWSIADNDNPLHLPWQVLPRVSGNVKASAKTVEIGSEIDPEFGVPTGDVKLKNFGVGVGRVDSYSLIATSPNLPEGGLGANSPIIDLRNVGVATYPVPAGFCSADASFVMAFAINTWERQTHSVAPASFFVDIDTDGDGAFDYEVFNFDLAFPGIDDGRNVTWVADLAAETADAFFFTDHGTNSTNTVLTFCGEQIGMNAGNFFQSMDIVVGAFDLYFTGNVTDIVEDLTISPLGERYLGFLDDFGTGDIPSGATKTLTVLDFGPVDTNPNELGLLLLLDASRGAVRGGAPARNEALALPVVPSDFYIVPE